MFSSKKDMHRAMYLFYAEKVRKLTEKTFKNEYIENSHLRGQGWHLDHKLSIKECFNNNIPVEIASHICNLQIVPSSYNHSKGSKSCITPKELYEEYILFEKDNDDFL